MADNEYNTPLKRRPPLTRDMLDSDPNVQFDRWYADAEAAGLDAETMALATATADGAPSLRMVLLRGHDADGYIFYTNYTSRKSLELQENPQAALLFYWREIYRQVRISGQIKKVAEAESRAYWRSRPRGSQLGAWASRQSSELVDRSELEAAFKNVSEQFAGQEVPLPDFWGGFRLVPERFEFWQGREDRLHDRFRYEYLKNDWHLTRLAP